MRARVTMLATSLLAAGVLTLLPSWKAGLTAQEAASGRIVGRVIDGQTGSGMNGVVVQIVGTPIGVLSGVDGRYIIANAPVGTVALRAENLGYGIKTVTGVVVEAGAAVEQDITLEPQAVALEAIVPPPPAAAVISADITSNRTLFADTIYTLRGFIHVQPPATLTIQAGTTILGDFDVVGSSLFVLRGARIQAAGTADAPIVFTSSRPTGQRQAGDWGGLIIVGNGQINKDGVIELEGTGTGANNPPVNYGQGTDDADNSGQLRYVRVEFAGFGPAPNEELNSFTFADVGSGTQFAYLQSLAGLDGHFKFVSYTNDL